MSSFGLISLASALLGATVLDFVEERLHPLSGTQIASAFSGKAIKYVGEIRIEGYDGIFCPDGTYARPRHRIGPVRGSYVISEGAISVEGEGFPPQPMRLQVFGDASGGVFVKRDDYPLIEVRFETPRPGWCA